MNRELRRYEKKYLKQENKQIKNRMEKQIERYFGPCCYVNNKPVYYGACVFLKKDTEISGQYNWQLNNLIEQNHRFVIQFNDGKVGGCMVVSLLSTSQYLNEDKKLGIRLLGDYHSNKYVYMDARNSYVIKSSCIKSVDYNLDEYDRHRCVMTIRNNKTDLVTLHKGLLFDETIDEAHKHFVKPFNEKLSADEQQEMDVKFIRDYVYGLPYDLVKLQLNEEYKKSKKCETLIKKAGQTLKDEVPNLSEEDFFRKLLILYLAAMDDLNVSNIAATIQRGY